MDSCRWGVSCALFLKGSGTHCHRLRSATRLSWNVKTDAASCVRHTGCLCDQHKEHLVCRRPRRSTIFFMLNQRRWFLQLSTGVEEKFWFVIEAMIRRRCEPSAYIVRVPKPARQHPGRTNCSWRGVRPASLSGPFRPGRLPGVQTKWPSAALFFTFAARGQCRGAESFQGLCLRLITRAFGTPD